MTGGASPRRRGDYFERQVRAHLEAHGYLVVRSGGSLGAADLMAVRRNVPPLIVSCKIGARLTPAERASLEVLAKRHGVLGMLAWRAAPGRIGWRRVSPNPSSDADPADPEQ